MCKKVTIVQITLKFIPTFTDQTYILLTHCIPVRLSRNSHIWYPGWRRDHVLIKYSQKYNFFVFVFNLTEVETAALKIFCVMIPSLVYTCCDFGLFRVVRPYDVLAVIPVSRAKRVSCDHSVCSRVTLRVSITLTMAAIYIREDTRGKYSSVTILNHV